MKKYVYISVVISTLMLLASCYKGDEIGNLYGRWKLDSFSCSQSGTVEVQDVFMGFTGEVYSLHVNKGYDWGMFAKTDTELYLNKAQYGTNFHGLFLGATPTAKFSIKQLDSKNLVLQRNDSIWTFSKLLGK